MTVSKTAVVEAAKETAKASRPARKEPAEAAADGMALQLGELSELLGYSLKRAQLKVFEDFLRCVAPLQLTPAQFSVLLLLDKNPGRNQTEIANTLGILRPNFVAMLDGLESRDLCARIRSTNDRRSHILVLTDKGRAGLGPAEQIALHLRAALGLDLLELLDCLHALGGRDHAHPTRQRCDRTHDVQRTRILRDVLHKGAVDLDLVERKALQIGERGI